MSKRNTLGGRQKAAVRPVDELLFNTDSNENKQLNKHVNIQTKQEEDDELKRQTYYLSKDIIKALSLYTAFEDTDKSEAVRDALTAFIPKKYFEM